MDQQTPVSQGQPPVSGYYYDFRPERVAAMDAGEVEMELANLHSGNPSHPYCNAADGRHAAANGYAMALHERQIALRPVRDEGAEYIAAQAAERRGKAQQIQRHLTDIGFERFNLPAELEDVHLEIMERDALIQEGKLREAFFALRRPLSEIGLAQDPTIAPFLSVLEDAINQSDLDTNPTRRQLATDAAFAIQRVLSRRQSDDVKAARKRANEIVRAQAEKQTRFEAAWRSNKPSVK